MNDMATDKQNTRPNVPPLRFPEFTEPWERKSLGDIGETIIGLTYKPTDVVKEGGVIVLRSSNIQNGFIDYKDIVRVDKKIKDNILTREHDLLVCARNGSPRLIGKNAILSKADANQTFGAFMMVFRSPYNHFVHHLLATKRYISQVSENLGARINQITSSDLNSFEFFFPNSLEMEKIAELIDLLDRRIAVQSKIIEQLESLMDGIILNIIRADDCSKVLLSDILTERKETNSALYKVCSVSVLRGVVDQVQFLGRSFAAKDTSNYNVVHYGDIVYTKSPTGNFPYGIIKRSQQDNPVAVSPLYGVYEPCSNDIGCYLHYYFSNAVTTKNYLHKLIQKGAKNTINISNQRFLENYIRLPKADKLKKLTFLLNQLSVKKKKYSFI